MHLDVAVAVFSEYQDGFADEVLEHQRGSCFMYHVCVCVFLLVFEVYSNLLPQLLSLLSIYIGKILSALAYSYSHMCIS